MFQMFSGLTIKAE